MWILIDIKVFNNLLYFQEYSCPENLKNRLHACLSESIYFDEIAVSFTRMQTECHDFLAGLKQEGLAVEELFPPG